ncbi:MAG: cell division protein FtsL [Pseudomonadota bacterium]
MSVLSKSRSGNAESVSMSLIVILLLALCVTAIALAYTKHQSRRLFVELQTLSRERDSLNEEWVQLQLEQSTYAAHSLIEKKAATSLSLYRPAAHEVFLITDAGDFRFVGLEPMSEELALLLERQQTETSAVAVR